MYQEALIDELIKQRNEEANMGQLGDTDECEIGDENGGEGYEPKTLEDLLADKQKFEKIQELRLLDKQLE